MVSKLFDAAGKDGLLICEGASDAQLVRALFSVRAFERVYVRVCSDLGGSGTGNGAFARALRSARITPGFGAIKNVVLLADSDASRDANFNLIRDQVQQVATDPINPRVYPIPTSPNQKFAGNPSLTIVMVPTDATVGAIETLAFAAAKSVSATNVAEVETLATRVGVNGWLAHQQAKMKLHAFLACTHQAKPDITLTQVFSNHATHLVPVGDAAFDHLYTTLSGLLS